MYLLSTPPCDDFPLFAWTLLDACLSRPEAKLSTEELSAVQPQSPSVTSVTSVRYSPRCVSFPPRSQVVHRRALRGPTAIPLCDLRDLCAMLSSMRVFPPRSQVVHRRAYRGPTAVPHRDLRAMLFLNWRSSRSEAVLSTNLNPSP
jgi:hypothetical protein